LNFGPQSEGSTNTADCDATDNSGIWTFNSGTTPMVISLNSLNQRGAPTGPVVFVNNSTNVQLRMLHNFCLATNCGRSYRSDFGREWGWNLVTP